MLHLVPALRVKDVTIFELVDQEFHYGEFVFFSQLATHLGKIAAISAEDAQEIGVLSELMYLSSKIHAHLKEQTTTEQELLQALQMPVLLGDFLYGKFILYLAEAEKTELLPIYLAYLQQFNLQQVHILQGAEKQKKTYIQLLTAKTAEAIAALADMNSAAQNNLIGAAEEYLQEQWLPMQGERITTLAALENALQVAFV